MRNLLLGGLLLPLRLYLQPRAFCAQVDALAPDLPSGYSLWRARRKLRDPAFRRPLLQVVLQAIVALVWTPILALVALQVCSALGYEVDWPLAALGVVFGVPFSVAVGVVLGVPFGVAAGVAGSMASSVVFGVGVGVTSRVAFDVVFGMATGVVLVVAFGVGVGVTPSVVLVVASSVMLAIWSGMAYGIASGMAYGMAFMLGAFHVLNLPLECAISLASWMLARSAPGLSLALWRLSPVRWDEVILLPLPGLNGFLATLYRADPALGQAALAEVAAHRYQRRAAYRVLVRLAYDEARLVTSGSALASFGRGLAWLSDDVPLPGDTRALVLGMRDVSREVDSASKSDSATNRVRRLEAAADMIEPLRLQPGEFGAVLARWSGIVAAELEDARWRQRQEEPIPQVYVSDGRPIRPAGRPGTAPPFKGRETLFRQLEGALGSGEGSRTTFLLYGQRRTGKTSVLLHLPERLGSRMAPAFLDLQSEKLSGARDVAGLLGGLADEVVEEARRHRGIPLMALDHKRLAADPYPAFGRWLDQVEHALGERTLLLCLDEFEALEEAIQDGRFDRRILATLRSIVQHRSHMAVLLSGSHRIDELPPHWASALISTTTLPISFLEEHDARALIEQPVDEFPAIYAPAAVERILHLTRCQPYLVQLTCALLVERMNAAHRMPPASFVQVEDVDAVVPLALERGSNYFVDLWRTQAGSDVVRHVLEALARAPDAQMARTGIRLLQKDGGSLRQATATLLRREIIEPTDGGYRIVVPLVAEYACRQGLL